jgi:putative ABC transport system permease protein
MGSLLQDIRYGIRALANNPGFTIVAILTLALGIGANTAIFSVVDAVLLQRLPYQNPQSLVQIWNTYLPAWPRLGLSPGDFQDWRQQTQDFSEMAAYVDISQGFNLTGEGEPERVKAAFATSNLIPMLGVHPIIGRAFTPNEDKPASAPVILLSYRLWQHKFGCDPSAVGRAVMLDGKGYTLAGVLPAGFHLSLQADVWMPVGQYQDDLTGRLHHPYSVIARMKPGVTVARAQTELATLNSREELTFPDTHRGWGVLVQRMEDTSAAKLRVALLILFGAVTLVLLIACANIVNLLLARNAARQKEIALRIALGASKTRLMRQLLTESVLLSLLGGAFGILLANAGLHILQAFAPEDLASVKAAALNGSVLAFTIAVCALAGIACGLIPAFQSLKTDLHDALKKGGRGLDSSGGEKVRSFLVVSEIALALIPLIGAGLLLRSFHRLLEVDPGFRPDHVLTMQVSQPQLSAAELNKLRPDEQNQLGIHQSLEFEQIAERIASIPGVTRVGGIDVLPLGLTTVASTRFLVEGQTTPAAGAHPVAELRTASLGYFATIGIPLVRGRLFTEKDWTSSNIVINSAMAQRFWPGADSIGKRINLCWQDPQPCWSPVIGVVGNVHQYGLDTPQTLDMYTAGGWTPYLLIRTSSDPSLVAHAAVEAVHKISPALPVTNVMTLDDILSVTVSPRRFSTVLLAVFAILALVLASVGIYGVMSYVVSLRTNEMGIRMALGAQPRDVLGLVLGRGTKLALSGVAIGMAGAFTLSRFISSLLFGVQSTDPAIFLGVALLLVAVALAACYFPARRAMTVNPLVALRYE